MDLIDRLIQFPSMFRSIDNNAWIEHLIIYPFFGLLYILQSLRYQADLIDDGKEYAPPVLANDGIYTWYRMGIMHEMQKSVVLDDVLEENTGHNADLMQEDIPAREMTSASAVTDPTDALIETAGIEPAPLKDGEGSQAPEDMSLALREAPATVVKIKAKRASKPRVIVNSLFIKAGAEKIQMEDAAYFNAEEEELSGFARFLRQKTVSTGPDVAQPEEAEEYSSLPEDPEEKYQHLHSSSETESVSQESRPPRKKKKKKKKKDLVDRLVQQSLLDNELLVSEPFAELLYAQGYREKAIKIYEKLMDKNPEKKIIFAAKIDQINKENI